MPRPIGEPQDPRTLLALFLLTILSLALYVCGQSSGCVAVGELDVDAGLTLDAAALDAAALDAADFPDPCGLESVECPGEPTQLETSP